MSKTKQTIQSNLKNPYLDPIMDVFNSNEKDKQIIKELFTTIKLNNDKKRDEFCKKINNFIKDAKDVANKNKELTAKDIEKLQKEKLEILNMIKNDYKDLSKKIINAINNGDTTQLEDIKNKIDGYEGLNDTDKYNLGTLIDEAIKIETGKNNEKQKQEIQTKIKQAISNCGKQKTQLELALDVPIACCCINIEKTSDDSDYRNKIYYGNQFNKALCPTTNPQQMEEALQQVHDFCDIAEHVIKSDEFKKCVRTGDVAKISGVIDKIKEYFLINNNLSNLNNVLNSKMSFLNRPINSFVQFINTITTENKNKYVDNMVNMLLEAIELMRSTCDVTKNNKKHFEKISEKIVEFKRQNQDILVKEYKTKFSELREDYLKVKNNDSEDFIEEIKNKNKQNLIKNLTDILTIIKNDNNFMSTNRFENKDKVGVKVEEKDINSVIEYLNGELINIYDTVKKNVNKLLIHYFENLEETRIENYTYNIMNRGVSDIFTETGSFITKYVLLKEKKQQEKETMGEKLVIKEEQKTQLCWNKIYVGKANPDVSQQQDCLKIIQDISPDNPRKVNKYLIREIIDNEKNYEILTKIHGTDHNEAENDINITEDTITISEKNKTGNYKDDSIILISDYVLNKKYKDKNSKKNFSLLDTSDQRPTNELANLLLQLSELKEDEKQSGVYKRAIQRIAKFIQNKVITENVEDKENNKHEFPGTSAGIVISALKNLYDTRFENKDPQKKQEDFQKNQEINQKRVVGEVFGDVMVELRILMGDKYKEDFEDKVNDLIKKSREKVNERKKQEEKEKIKKKEEQEKNERQNKANKEIQDFNNNYIKFSGNFTILGDTFDKKVNSIENNINEIKKLKEQVEEYQNKFSETGEFRDIESVEIDIEGEKKTLNKEDLNKKFEEYKNKLNDAEQKQKKELRNVMSEQRTELIKKMKNLQEKVGKGNEIEDINIGMNQLESDIDEYNDLIEKYNEVINSGDIKGEEKIKINVSDGCDEYKDLIVAVKMFEYKEEVNKGQKEQEEEWERQKEEEKKRKQEEDLNNKKNSLKEIKYKGKTEQDDKYKYISEEGEKGRKDIGIIIQNPEQEGEKISKYYNNYNSIITRVKDGKDLREKIKEYDIVENDLIDMLSQFEENIETLGVNDKNYFNDSDEKNKEIKSYIVDAQKQVVKNINEYFNQKISADGTAESIQILESLIGQGQYINNFMLPANKEKKIQKEDILFILNNGSLSDEKKKKYQEYNNKISKTIKPIRDEFYNDIDININLNEYTEQFKEISNYDVDLKSNLQSDIFSSDLDKTVSNKVKELKDDKHKTAGEVILYIEEIKGKYEEIIKKLEELKDKITLENYKTQKEEINNNIKEAEELQQEIQKFTTKVGVFKDFEDELLNSDFDKVENVNDGENKNKGKLDTLLEACIKLRNEVKEQVEKEAEEQKNKKKQEVKERAKNHTKDRKKEKLIDEAKEYKKKLRTKKMFIIL